MAQVEGRGLVPPGCKIVHLSDEELAQLERLGRLRADYRRYETRHDAWGRGFSMNPIFHGLVGEAAVANYVNARVGRQVLGVDSELHAKGDGGIDLRIGDLTIDVKTAGRNGHPMLIRRVDERGRLKELKASAFVLVDGEDVSRPQIVGWIRRNRLIEFGKSSRAAHYNIEVPRASLRHVNSLVDAVKTEIMKGERR